jgi:hypothetical protein
MGILLIGEFIGRNGLSRLGLVGRSGAGGRTGVGVEGSPVPVPVPLPFPIRERGRESQYLRITCVFALIK